MIEGLAQDYADFLCKGKRFSAEKLFRYGFEREEDEYRYFAYLLNGDAGLSVVIDDTGKVSTQVLDLSIQDYVTRLVCNDDTGEGLAGDLRRACESVLADIVEKCTSEKNAE